MTEEEGRTLLALKGCPECGDYLIIRSYYNWDMPCEFRCFKCGYYEMGGSVHQLLERMYDG